MCCGFVYCFVFDGYFGMCEYMFQFGFYLLFVAGVFSV